MIFKKKNIKDNWRISISYKDTWQSTIKSSLHIVFSGMKMAMNNGYTLNLC